MFFLYQSTYSLLLIGAFQREAVVSNAMPTFDLLL